MLNKLFVKFAQRLDAKYVCRSSRYTRLYSSKTLQESEPRADKLSSERVEKIDGSGKSKMTIAREDSQVSSPFLVDAFNKESKRQRSHRYFWTTAIISSIGISGVIYLGQPSENDILEKGWYQKILGYLKRSISVCKGGLQSFESPPETKLLPDLLPPGYQRPYTLVVCLEDLLVHSFFEPGHGWRTAKRPGTDRFLAYLSQLYEIVIFTSLPFHVAYPIIEKLDPYNYALYKLYRDATEYHKGRYVKNLSLLNRDLNKIILLDVNADSATFQPENAIILNPWLGDPEDTELFRIISYFEDVGLSSVDDVKPLITQYHSKSRSLDNLKETSWKRFSLFGAQINDVENQKRHLRENFERERYIQEEAMKVERLRQEQQQEAEMKNKKLKIADLFKYAMDSVITGGPPVIPEESSTEIN